jgi:hypothetical protein
MATTYYDHAAARAAAGKDAFDYSNDAVRSGVLRVHQTLDPRGMKFRESRDSAEHPDSNAIIIGLDVTGSMSAVVRGIHADLPRLHELILGHNYIPHPQILFAAVGDATCDAVPLQVGQFESDNRMDQNLENMILEGGGGGQKTESYELLMYVAARHTSTDCWEKRKRKGYLFIIGDEMAYPAVDRSQIASLIGTVPDSNLSIEALAAEVTQRYHTYFIIPGGASYGGDKEVCGFWRRLLGRDRVIRLNTPEETSESIAVIIGMNEGAITTEDGLAKLRKRGMVGRTVDRVTKAIGALVTTPDRARRL